MVSDRNTQQNMRSGTILIVDDNISNLELLRSVIGSETPHTPLAFGSADETLQHLEQIIEAKPILFLLDYRLTTMTGLDLFDHLRQHTALGQQPAIMLTAAGIDEQLKRASAQRHIEMIEKPFDIADLLRCIEHSLSCCVTSI